MALTDAWASSGSDSRFKHWLTAGILITLLAIGLYFEGPPRGDEKLF